MPKQTKPEKAARTPASRPHRMNAKTPARATTAKPQPGPHVAPAAKPEKPATAVRCKLFGAPLPVEQLGLFHTPSRMFSKLASGAEAVEPIARASAIDATHELRAMPPLQLRAELAKKAAAEKAARMASWQANTARSWSAETPADRRIARQYKPDETPTLM